MGLIKGSMVEGKARERFFTRRERVCDALKAGFLCVCAVGGTRVN